MGAKSILSWTELTRNPHVTHQPEGKLHVGDTVDINDLDLVTKRPDDTRELVAYFSIEK